jgi:hypothetical protein
MESWTIVELEIEARMAEAEQRRRRPVLPPGPGIWASLRQTIATALVSAGLRMDVDASHAAVRAFRGPLDHEECLEEAA